MNPMNWPANRRTAPTINFVESVAREFGWRIRILTFKQRYRT
jgi:hypothetical protein